jgi:hypothetical protein
MSLKEAKQAYKLFGQVADAQSKMEKVKNEPGALVDEVGDSLKKKANDLLGLRRGVLKGKLNILIREASGIVGHSSFLEVLPFFFSFSCFLFHFDK